MLSKAKWIAEPWDLGLGGYGLGRFPEGWAEWNDRFRDTTRRFWRGEAHGPLTSDLATRLSGSEDVFHAKGPLASLNYVISHDGFTLADLVSYSHKHNEANGEDNRDGTQNNLSRNWGTEGPTDDPEILALRDRARRNLVATLLLAQGVPLLQHGDELGRSQRGNNNPYCQDNAITWTDWSGFLEDSSQRPFFDFVRGLLAIRRRFPHLRRPTFLRGGEDDPDVLWLGTDGRRLGPEDWSRPDHRAFAMVMLPPPTAAPSKEGARSDDATGHSTLVLLVNGGESEARFRLPGPAVGRSVAVLAETAEGFVDAAAGTPEAATDPFHAVPACSLSLLVAFPGIPGNGP
jgi:glycogen operon protein